MTTNVDIVGATGYTGQELIEILLNHPNVKISGLYSTTDKPKPLAQLLPRFKNKTDLICQKLDKQALIADKSEVVFLALPHSQSMDFVADLLACGKSVVDLGADYRFKNVALYEQFYQKKHKDKANLVKAVYGLPEIYRAKIKKAKLVANPGCYPTAAILGLAPLVATESIVADSIIIDAKSGTSGAGKKLCQEMQAFEACGNFKPYKINCHQHMPEIEQELVKFGVKNVKVVFVPHLLPVKRGILETIYLKQVSGVRYQLSGVINLYKKFYKKEPFVRINHEGSFPSLKDVVGTNYCDLGLGVFGRDIIVVSAIDNLLKGASGQAVQNMNIMLGYPEATGLLRG